MQTKVTQVFTMIKVFNSENGEVEIHRLIGKVLNSELKSILTNLGYPPNSVVVGKSFERETFTVNSEALYQLKQSSTEEA